MTHRDLISTYTAAFVALALLATVAGAGAATQTADGPAIRLTDGTTTAGGNTTVDVVLTSAPDGLAGYYLDLTVESPDGTRIVNASYPDRFGLTTTPEYSDDRSTVTLEAADLNDAVEPGATDIRLATVELSGGASGGASLAVEPRQFDDDDGNTFEPARATTQATAARSGSTSGDAAGSNSATQGGTADASVASGPLPPALVVIAVVLLAGVGLRRRGAR